MGRRFEGVDHREGVADGAALVVVVGEVWAVGTKGVVGWREVWGELPVELLVRRELALELLVWRDGALVLERFGRLQNLDLRFVVLLVLESELRLVLLSWAFFLREVYVPIVDLLQRDLWLWLVVLWRPET